MKVVKERKEAIMGCRLAGFLIVSVVLGLSGIVLNCANPVDKDPLKWKWASDVPLTNKSFNIAEELEDAYEEDSMDIINGSKRVNDLDLSILDPDTAIGDTVEFSAFKHDSSWFDVHERSSRISIILHPWEQSR